MSTVRLHPTDPEKLIVDLTFAERRQVTCDTVEQVIETIRLDPAFERFDNPPFTVRQLASREMRRWKANGLRSFKGNRSNHDIINATFGDRRACTVTSKDVMQWAASLAPDYAHNTICLAVTRLGAIFREAVQSRILWEDPTREARKQYRASPTAAASYPTAEEEARLIASADNLRDRVLLRLVLDAGVLKSELGPLRHGDFDGKVLRITKSVNLFNEVFDALPHCVRPIPLTQALIEDLSEMRRLSGGAPGDLILPSRTGAAMARMNSFEAALARIQVKAGLGTKDVVKRPSKRDRRGFTIENVPRGDYRLEQLGARAAVKWLREGVNPVLVMRRMGYGSYERFSHRYRAAIGALPEGNGIASIDQVIWRPSLSPVAAQPAERETSEEK